MRQSRNTTVTGRGQLWKEIGDKKIKDDVTIGTFLWRSDSEAVVVGEALGVAYLCPSLSLVRYSVDWQVTQRWRLSIGTVSPRLFFRDYVRGIA